MSGRWEGSNRLTTLPPNWAALRPPILHRDDHRCTWLHGHPDGDPERYIAGVNAHGWYAPPERCEAPARDVDHIGDPEDHTPDNLRSLCTGHHGKRSSRQGNAARWRHREKRESEKHPGLR